MERVEDVKEEKVKDVVKEVVKGVGNIALDVKEVVIEVKIEPTK